ncbi:MAG: hypothetical protein KME15_07610 [Drouetiella hepatica Uher 2000/2452]|jgi:hypothetical protein|uniref:DUF4278 domain-containing protein n=1 Tax=Drouetiella hepatica Uher 2000/2452 TaxID=904376 RepID=A0A951Q9S9_9CYAN|nr:hypothetical protein [Drouetiella hepatica Uher 2000/2452]
MTTTFKYHGADYSLEPTSSPESKSDRPIQYGGQIYTGEGDSSFVQPVMGLVYHGIAYRTTLNEALEATEATQSANNRPIKPVPVHSRLSSPTTSRGANQLHRRQQLQSLQRRMAIARAKGDRHLTLQLQKELEALTEAK